MKNITWSNNNILLNYYTAQRFEKLSIFENYQKKIQ